MSEYGDKIVEVSIAIGKKVDNKEYKGTVDCPFCGGKIEYVYENAMAMRAKCKSCSFRLFA